MPTVTAHRMKVLPDLTAIRERKGISLEQISRNTKISARYLEAIERSEFEQLPGGVFRTSYIRQYARAIDYDEWDLLAYFANMLDAQTTARRVRPPQPKFLGMFKVPQPLGEAFRIGEKSLVLVGRIVRQPHAARGSGVALVFELRQPFFQPLDLYLRSGACRQTAARCSPRTRAAWARYRHARDSAVFRALYGPSGCHQPVRPARRPTRPSNRPHTWRLSPSEHGRSTPLPC